jgi:RNA polymerase sigma-70 factor (ECF subfamily)
VKPRSETSGQQAAPDLRSSGLRDVASARAADASLLDRLLAGDEAAFSELVRTHHAAMVRVAAAYVPTRAVAEEVVQDAWIAVLRGLEGFERRSSLKTWIFRIVANRARTRAQRERSTVPISSLGEAATTPTVDPDRFLPPGHEWAGGWASPPASWEGIPEQRLLSAETLAQVRESIERLSPNQRTVITLRDVEGWSAAEVRAVLEIGEVNQRVLLHRARARVRGDLERYFDEGSTK